MKQRGNRWWCQVRVPDALRARLCKKVIQVSLGTADLIEARHLRWPHVHSIKATFARALSDDDISSEEIEQIAQAEYQRQVAVERLNINGDIDAALAEEIVNLGWELEDGTGAAAMPDGEVIKPDDPMVAQIEKETGIELSEPKREELRKSLIRAQLSALDNILRRRRGQAEAPVGLLNPSVKLTRVPQVSTAPGSILPVSEAVNSYLAAREGEWINKTYGQISTSLRLFCDHVGHDTDLSQIKRLDVSQWRERMRQLHPRWASSAASKGKTLDELLAVYGNGPETLSDKTLARHLSALHSLFDWAIDTGHLDGANPVKVSGGKSAKRYNREEFSDAEVRAIFSGWKFETAPRRHMHANALPWIALIGAYSVRRQIN